MIRILPRKPDYRRADWNMTADEVVRIQKHNNMEWARHCDERANLSDLQLKAARIGIAACAVALLWFTYPDWLRYL